MAAPPKKTQPRASHDRTRAFYTPRDKIMRILNLSYHNVPNLPEHEMLHRSILDIRRVGWIPFIGQIQAFAPDLIIEREYNDSVALYTKLYEAFPKVHKAWWWIDAHVLYEYRKPYARNFDTLFLAVSRFVDKAQAEIGRRAFWLPLCCPWEASGCIPPPPVKDLDIVFVARTNPVKSFGRRLAAIADMNGAFGEQFLYRETPDMVNLVRRAKVGFNNAYNQDLNFRVFETLGLGTELLTDNVPDLWDIPGLADKINVYDNRNEMIEMAQHMLDGNLLHLMDHTQEWIRKNHCIEHRYRQMIKEIQCNGLI